MLGLKLNHVSKSGPRALRLLGYKQDIFSGIASSDLYNQRICWRLGNIHTWEFWGYNNNAYILLTKYQSQLCDPVCMQIGHHFCFAIKINSVILKHTVPKYIGWLFALLVVFPFSFLILEQS